MELVSLRVENFRRFSGSHTIQVAPKVVAFVGPNDVGKSSLLRAFSGVNDPGWGARDKAEHAQGDLGLSAMFLLDDHDREAIRGLKGADAVLGYTALKRADGSLGASVWPEIPAEQDTVVEFIKALEAFLTEFPEAVPPAQTKKLRAEFSKEVDEMSAAAKQAVTAVRALLDVDGYSGDVSDEKKQHEWVARAKAYQDTVAGERLREAAIAVAESHSASASGPITDILIGREPPILLYSSSDRQLEGTYSLGEPGDAAPPAPLLDLLNLAGSSVEQLRDVATGDDAVELLKLRKRINGKLKDFFTSYWPERGLTLQLDVVRDRILLTVLDSRVDSSTRLEDHSDGFRSFLALLAFTATRAKLKDVKPILLVDEADLHLHYDAQASLVSMFQNQQFATKVLYTTHSAGCLPEDLGSVRRVCASGPDGSEVKNGIWENNGGVQPLLLGLGASAFAFGSMRRALFVEGPSDAVLLPAIFREVGGTDRLGFQIVPGLAWLTPEALCALPAEAGAAAYLVDGDVEGEEIAGRLEEVGVGTDSVFFLRGPKNASILEDFVSASILADAVNELLRAQRREAPALVTGDLRPGRHAESLAAWFEANSLAPLAKPLLAQAVIRIWQSQDGKARQLVVDGADRGLATLLERIQKQLRVPSVEDAAAGLG